MKGQQDDGRKRPQKVGVQFPQTLCELTLGRLHKSLIKFCAYLMCFDKFAK